MVTQLQLFASIRLLVRGASGIDLDVHVSGAAFDFCYLVRQSVRANRRSTRSAKSVLQRRIHHSDLMFASRLWVVARNKCT